LGPRLRIYHRRLRVPKKRPGSHTIIPATAKIVLVGVQPACKSAGSRWRSRQKQVRIGRIIQIGLVEERQSLVRTHPEIVRTAESRHFACNLEDGLRRFTRDLIRRRFSIKGMPLRVSLDVRVACDFEMQPSFIVYLNICVIPCVRSRPTFALALTSH
jgi:hypothetical protein